MDYIRHLFCPNRFCWSLKEWSKAFQWIFNAHCTHEKIQDFSPQQPQFTHTDRCTSADVAVLTVADESTAPVSPFVGRYHEDSIFTICISIVCCEDTEGRNNETENA